VASLFDRVYAMISRAFVANCEVPTLMFPFDDPLFHQRLKEQSRAHVFYLLADKPFGIRVIHGWWEHMNEDKIETPEKVRGNIATGYGRFRKPNAKGNGDVGNAPPNAVLCIVIAAKEHVKNEP
jgi:hypothetical protein